MMISNLPVLYSFRRCPYAMRARLALVFSHTKIELREILLRDKPEEMVAISAKATVPVLQLVDGSVMDESIDIMCWALTENDPNNLLDSQIEADVSALILRNDLSFKPLLDNYKYATRFPEKTAENYRDECDCFLSELESRLSSKSYLCGEQLSLADIAIFPFVRQFAGVDRDWFEQSPYLNIRQWLLQQTSSEIFAKVMTKFELWKDDKSKKIVFPN